VGDAWIFIPVLVLAVLLAMPAVRRWFSNDDRRPLVDPDQSITADPVLGQGEHFFRHRLTYRSRWAARGRRHEAPAVPSSNRVRRDPPTGRD
jgi:hypothetical protein